MLSHCVLASSKTRMACCCCIGSDLVDQFSRYHPNHSHGWVPSEGIMLITMRWFKATCTARLHVLQAVRGLQLERLVIPPVSGWEGDRSKRTPSQHERQSLCTKIVHVPINAAYEHPLPLSLVPTCPEHHQAMQTQKYALVTGGNRGIGLEICKKLVERGKPVLLTARSAGAAQQAAEQLHSRCSGVDVQPFALEAADPGSVSQLVASLQKYDQQIDLLVSCRAGCLAARQF